MVSDLYSNILQELGELLGTNLEPDAQYTCMIRMEPGIEVFVEMDKAGKNTVLGADIGEVPPGAYRESVFREALRWNGKKAPRLGIFAYSPQSQSLLFYNRTDIEKATGAYIFALLSPFAKVAHSWREALVQGNIPDTGIEETSPSDRSGPGLFGLHR